MALRDSWIEEREKAAAAANGNRNMSQMHLARQGVITEEMQHIAKRERLEPELIRSEVARGRCIIPANINHRNLEPMAIGIATKCKINANIGNSATNSNIDEELKKLTPNVVTIPAMTPLLSAILEIVPLQLLAYHIAVLRGVDVDRPLGRQSDHRLQLLRRNGP